jgi:hypothetical protein
MKYDQITQLAKTFSTACKDVAEKSKAPTYTASVVLSVMVVLLGSPKGLTWIKM